MAWLRTVFVAYMEAATGLFYKRRCSQKFYKFHRKKPVLESLFNKAAGQGHTGKVGPRTLTWDPDPRTLEWDPKVGPEDATLNLDPRVVP